MNKFSDHISTPLSTNDKKFSEPMVYHVASKERVPTDRNVQGSSPRVASDGTKGALGDDECKKEYRQQRR